MFYIYVLQYSVNQDLYIGYTDNIRRRLEEHNRNKNKCRPQGVQVFGGLYTVKRIARKLMLKNERKNLNNMEAESASCIRELKTVCCLKLGLEVSLEVLSNLHPRYMSTQKQNSAYR